MFNSIILEGSAVLPTPIPVSDVMEQAGTVVSSILSWISSVGNAIVQNGVIFLTIGVLVLGSVIGIFGRLLRRN